jgi:dATP pyrophosphohydrolase
MAQLRTDIVDVYVFRRGPGGAVGANVEFLQLRRCKGALCGSWQTIMGHSLPGESAAQTAVRELKEETAFDPAAMPGFWQLEEVNTYFLASHDAIVISPCFAVEVPAASEPVLNDEHDAARWVKRDHVDRAFVWPGQRQAIAGIIRDILGEHATMREVLRVRI